MNLNRTDFSYYLWRKLKNPKICNWLDHWILCDHDWYVERETGDIRCVVCYMRGIYVKGGMVNFENLVKKYRGLEKPYKVIVHDNLTGETHEYTGEEAHRVKETMDKWFEENAVDVTDQFIPKEKQRWKNE